MTTLTGGSIGDDDALVSESRESAGIDTESSRRDAGSDPFVLSRLFCHTGEST